jgi:hypothetical protein
LRLTSTPRVELGPIARGQASAYAGAIAGAGGSASRRNTSYGRGVRNFGCWLVLCPKGCVYLTSTPRVKLTPVLAHICNHDHRLAVTLQGVLRADRRQRKKRANSWNDFHSRIECLDSVGVIKNMLGFRACNFQHVSLAPGQTVFSYCGADPSKAKKRLSSPMPMPPWAIFFPAGDPSSAVQKWRRSSEAIPGLFFITFFSEGGGGGGPK